MSRPRFRRAGSAAIQRRLFAYESLEDRRLLTANVVSNQTAWFETGTAEPAFSDATSWIVQLTDQGTTLAGNPSGVEPLLDSESINLSVVRGLGLPGMVLVAGPPSQAHQIEAALESHPLIASFQADRTIAGQAPNDPRFEDGSLYALENDGSFGEADADIDAQRAWDEYTTGSPRVTVGVIDSGVALAHPDLYLNIWINQGEIPPALRSQLTDIDGDSRFTFRDLNDPANADHVTEQPDDANNYIDAYDLLADPNWIDDQDNDGNGFLNDLFGWDFIGAGDQPLGAAGDNDPTDEHGHGTHVAGTIAAIGDNGVGVTGVSWSTSIMPLRFLDAERSGRISDAIAAIMYATMMRSQFGVDVPITNNSWGYRGEEDPMLRAALEANAAADMLFVAAAGNGDALGFGIDNDADPEFAFYPASDDLDHVVSVAATDSRDRLARFSNFGATTVDIAAPGVGILSTDIHGDDYAVRSGTSMAAPHVAGVAALLWVETPEATATEVKAALLDPLAVDRGEMPDDLLYALQGKTVAGGRLNAAGALSVDTLAPRAEILQLPDVNGSNVSEITFTISFTDNRELNTASVDGDEIEVIDTYDGTVLSIVSHQNLSSDTDEVVAEYTVAAPGGVFQEGDFNVILADNSVLDAQGNSAFTTLLGSFNVDTTENLIRAKTLNDGDDTAPDAYTLRAAVIAANSAPENNTIRLTAGTYVLSQEGSGEDVAATGDLDISGNLLIKGAGADVTFIDAQQIDRVFHILDGATAELRDLSIVGGDADLGGGVLVDNGGALTLTRVVLTQNEATDQGGGIFVATGGSVSMTETTLSENQALQGGGIFNAGSLTVTRSTLHHNQADGGGGLDNHGTAIISDSTFSGNVALQQGGAILSSDGTVTLTNVTLAENAAVESGGAIARPDTLGDGDENNGPRELEWIDQGLGGVAPDGRSFNPAITGDGRYLAFSSTSSNLVANDTNGVEDVFLYDRENEAFELISVDNNGLQWTYAHSTPAISDDARYVAFSSIGGSIWVRDRLLNTTKIVHDVTVPFQLSGEGRHLVYANDNGQLSVKNHETGFVETFQSSQAFYGVSDLGISADGRYLAFKSGNNEIFVYDRQEDALELVSSAQDGTPANGFSYSPAMSGDGRFVAFVSDADNLVPGDNNFRPDIYLKDRLTGAIQRVVESPQNLNGYYEQLQLNFDGSYLGFASDATHLVPFDENNAHDIFVANTLTGEIERPNVSNSGAEANLETRQFSLADNGQTIAFSSWATNLAATPGSLEHLFVSSPSQNQPPTPNQSTVSVANTLIAGNRASSGPNVWGTVDSQGHNLLASPADQPQRSLEWLDVGLGGVVPEADAYSPSVSRDGRYVVFSSSADNLVSNDTNGVADIFLYDRLAKSLELISVKPDSSPRDVSSGSPNISADGRYVTYRTQGMAAFLDRQLGVTTESSMQFGWPYEYSEGGKHVIYSGDGVWVANVQTGFAERIDIRDDGYFGRGSANYGVSLSADGRYAAFSYQGDNLIPDAYGQIYVYDRSLDSMEVVSRASDGTIGNQQAQWPAISGDGRFVAFVSEANNLVPDDNDFTNDVFVVDRETGAIRNVTNAPMFSYTFYDQLELSADGRYLAFVSEADFLAPFDENLWSDVFVIDLLTDEVVIASVNAEGTQANGGSVEFALSSDGMYVSFTTDATNLVDAITSNPQYVRHVFLSGVGGSSADSSGWVSSDLIDAAANLGPLVNNGGRTLTHDLLPGSDAVDRGDNAFASQYDQRGIDRVLDASGDGQGTVDIGAVESYYGTVRGRRYHDLNENGSYDFGETGIAGAGMFLDADQDGEFDPGEPFALAGDDGVFEITGVPPGDYELLQLPLAGWRDSAFARTLELVDVGLNGELPNGRAYESSVSEGGRFVVLTSAASNLVEDDNNGVVDVFLYERDTHTIERISQNGGSSPAISGDGRFVVYVTTSGLVTYDREANVSTQFEQFTSANFETFPPPNQFNLSG